MNHRTLTARPTHLGPREVPAPPTHGMTMAQMAALECRATAKRDSNRGKAGGLPASPVAVVYSNGKQGRPKRTVEMSTRRDRVAPLMAQGFTYREIAAKLDITPGVAAKDMSAIRSGKHIVAHRSAPDTGEKSE